MMLSELSSSFLFSRSFALVRHVRTSVAMLVLLLLVVSEPTTAAASFSIHPATATTSALSASFNSAAVTVFHATTGIVSSRQFIHDDSDEDDNGDSNGPLIGQLVDDVATTFEAATKKCIEAPLNHLPAFENAVTSIEADVVITSPQTVGSDKKYKNNNNRLRERRQLKMSTSPATVDNVGARTKPPTAVTPSQTERLDKKEDNDDDRTKPPKESPKKPPKEATPSATEGPDKKEDNGNDRTKLWIILGSIGLLSGVVILVCIRHRISDCRNNQGLGKHVSAAATSLAPDGATTSSRLDQQSYYDSESVGNNKLAFSAEIDVDRQDDVSTLGDPVLSDVQLGHNSVLGADEHEDQLSESIGSDYDYVQGTMPSFGEEEKSESFSLQSSGVSRLSKALGGDGHVGHNVLADDSSLDEKLGLEEQAASQAELDIGAVQRYAVKVPAGKLGMVIDAPNGRHAIVHEIKPESILIGRVRAGDQLVAVDHEDVTSMTAVQVSQLINYKSDKPRLLVFVRARGRFDTADLVLKEGTGYKRT